MKDKLTSSKPTRRRRKAPVNVESQPSEFDVQEELIRESIRLHKQFDESSMDDDTGLACTYVMQDFFTGECANTTSTGKSPAIMVMQDPNGKPQAPWWSATVEPCGDLDIYQVRVRKAFDNEDLVVIEIGTEIRFFRRNVAELIAERIRMMAEELKPTSGYIRTRSELLHTSMREAAKEVLEQRSPGIRLFALGLKEYFASHIEELLVFALRQVALEGDAVARGKAEIEQPSLAEAINDACNRIDRDLRVRLATLPKNAKEKQVLDQDGQMLRRIDQALRIKGEDASLDEVAEHLHAGRRSLERRLNAQKLRLRTIKKSRAKS